MGQGLVLPETAQAGRPVVLASEGLEPGAYPIEIAGPDGVQVVTLVTTEGRGTLEWIPRKPGRYRFVLYAPGAKYTAEIEVAPPPPKVALTPEGLRVGERLWPLPPGDWLAPLEERDAVYLAWRGVPLVLAFPRDGSGDFLYGFYPHRPVTALEGGPRVRLEGGEAYALAALPARRPYQGDWGALEPLSELARFAREHRVFEHLPASPAGYRPYWVYLAEDPATLSEDALAAWGRDLLRRGHRPELAWGGEARAWTDRWQAAALAAGAAEARRIGLALLDYAPLHPGSRGFFLALANRLDAAGDAAAALRLREGARQARAFAPVLGSASLRRAVAALGLAYLALMIVLFARYLPAQRRGLAPLGGVWNSWVRLPLTRMRHLLLVYAGWGERLLAFLVFAALVAALVLWGSVRQFEAALGDPPIARATLVDASLETWPSGAGRAALAAYAALSEGKPAELPPRFPLAFAEALRHRLGDEAALVRAWRLEAAYPPLAEALRLGGDAWSSVYQGAGVERMGTPRARDLCRVYLAGQLSALPQQPTRFLEALGLGRGAAWALLLLLGVWLLLHVWVLLLPRPRAAFRAAGWLPRALELLVPGSNSLGKGWGVVLLLMAAYGALVIVEGEPVRGALWLAAAYLPHLLLWYDEVHR